MFERNYLSRQIRYDTQAVYVERDLNFLLIQATNRMSRLQNSLRSKKLNDQQRDQVRHCKIIQNLLVARRRLFDMIYENFDILKKTKDSSLHAKYLQAQRLLISTIRAEERVLLKRTQKKYDKLILIENIERQLSDATLKSDILSLVRERSQLAFLKRSRVEKILFFEQSSICLHEKSIDWRVQLINDLIALCDRRERRHSITRRETQRLLIESDESKKKSFTSDSFSLRCRLFQCLFCLENVDLSKEDRRHDYANRFSLRRHLRRCHAKRVREDNEIHCSHSHVECAELMFNDVSHFKNHVAKVHFVEM